MSNMKHLLTKLQMIQAKIENMEKDLDQFNRNFHVVRTDLEHVLRGLGVEDDRTETKIAGIAQECNTEMYTCNTCEYKDGARCLATSNVGMTGCISYWIPKQEADHD